MGTEDSSKNQEQSSAISEQDKKLAVDVDTAEVSADIDTDALGSDDTDIDIDIDIEAQLKALEQAEKAVDRAFASGKAERSKITQAAQLDAAEAVAMVGIAMESDEVADEAGRLSLIAEKTGDRDAAKQARRKERDARKKAKIDHRSATKSAKQAYDAIRFSAPNTLGFMRFVQILYALNIVFTLLLLIMTSRDTVVYDSVNILDWVMIILQGVAFWFFINRYKIARPWVIGISAFDLVVPICFDLITGVFDPLSWIWSSALNIFLIIYFATSKRVKATLVNDLSKHKGDYEKDDFIIVRRGWPFVRNLIIYFIIFSVLGHWMEAGMCQFIILGWVEGEYDPTNTMLWRDWLYPYPMEGAAVVIIALLLYPLKEWLVKKMKNPVLPYVISFFANALTCSIIEFSMGLIVNADHQLWDYSEQFGNIMGQVCLQNALAFGVAASLIAWFVYPLLERGIARIRPDIMNIIFVVVLIFGGILWSLYIIDPPEQVVEIVTETKEKKTDPDIESVSAAMSIIGAELNVIQVQTGSIEGIDHGQLDVQTAAIQSLLYEMAETLGIEPVDAAELLYASGDTGVSATITVNTSE